jgi:hypothetical protein
MQSVLMEQPLAFPNVKQLSEYFQRFRDKPIMCNHDDKCGRKFGCDTALMRHYSDKHPFAKNKAYKLPCGCAFIKQRGRTADQTLKLHVCEKQMAQTRLDTYRMLQAVPFIVPKVESTVYPEQRVQEQPPSLPSSDILIDYSIRVIPPEKLL